MVTRPDLHIHRHPRRSWTVLIWVLALLLSGTLVIGASLRSMAGHHDTATLPPVRDYHGCSTGVPGPPPGNGPGVLIVLSDDQPLTRVYGTLAANLASHFGPAHMITVSGYQVGMAASYQALIYIGASTGTRLSPNFMYDVLASGRRILWLGENIDQLAAYVGGFQTQYGWTPGPDVREKVRQIRYGSTSLTRDQGDTDPLTTIGSVDPATARVIGTVTTADGRSVPWAVRSGHLTYVTEIPLDASAENDRYLAVTDMLYDLLAPGTQTRHRALVRLEDIGPEADPVAVKAAGELLHGKGVPFSFGVFPVYVSPAGPHRREIRLRDRPALARAISYLLSHGGTMILHGYTHQSELAANPDNGESGQDFEFFQTHWDSHHTLVYDGPLRGDSTAWADRRFDAAAAELRAAHLPMPRVIEFPHYAASQTDYRAAAIRFGARYDRGQVFSPAWNGRSPASPYMFEQFAPYLTRDRYGSVVVPENLGFVQQVARPGHDTETVGTIVANARTQRVVRDNVASFFYHPFLGTRPLAQAVDQIKDLGYDFVSPCDL